MKKYYIPLMALAISLLTISCSNTDSYEDNNSTPSLGDVKKFNELSFLQNNLVQVSEDGSFIRRVNGLPINENDTTVVYIGKDNMAQAEETFIDWLAPNTIVTNIDNGLEARLTDEEGKTQGTVFFKPTDSSLTFNGLPTLAEVTFSQGTAIKHVTKVVFLPHSSWPLTRKESPYYVGDLVEKATYDEGVQKWLCIREAKEGESGLLVYLSHRTVFPSSSIDINKFASPSDAKTVSSIIRPHFDAFQKFFSVADMSLISGDYYWIDDYKVIMSGIYSIRLSDGDIDWWNVSFYEPHKRYIQVASFGMEEYPD